MCVSAQGVTGLKEHFLETAEEEVCSWVLCLVDQCVSASGQLATSTFCGHWFLVNM